MSLLQSILIFFVSPLLQLLLIIFFVYMVFSWLIAFNIVNLRNPAMAQIFGIIQRICEPILNPIRRIVPPLGGLDMAFLVIVLGLLWIQGYVLPTLIRAVG